MQEEIDHQERFTWKAFVREPSEELRSEHAKVKSFCLYSNNLTFFRHQVLKLLANRVTGKFFGDVVKTESADSLRAYCVCKQVLGEFATFDPKQFAEVH